MNYCFCFPEIRPFLKSVKDLEKLLQAVKACQKIRQIPSWIYLPKMDTLSIHVVSRCVKINSIWFQCGVISIFHICVKFGIKSWTDLERAGERKWCRDIKVKMFYGFRWFPMVSSFTDMNKRFSWRLLTLKVLFNAKVWWLQMVRLGYDWNHLKRNISCNDDVFGWKIMPRHQRAVVSVSGFWSGIFRDSSEDISFWFHLEKVISIHNIHDSIVKNQHVWLIVGCWINGLAPIESIS